MSNGDKPSPTPRTDALASAIPDDALDKEAYQIMAEGCRQLERELAQVREVLRRSDAENDELRAEASPSSIVPPPGWLAELDDLKYAADCPSGGSEDHRTYWEALENAHRRGWFGVAGGEPIAPSATEAKWIPVSERLPEPSKYNDANSVMVLTYSPEAMDEFAVRAGFVWFDYRGRGPRWDGRGDGMDVTHWKPLPSAPTDGVDKTNG